MIVEREMVGGPLDGKFALMPKRGRYRIAITAHAPGYLRLITIERHWLYEVEGDKLVFRKFLTNEDACRLGLKILPRIEKKGD